MQGGKALLQDIPGLGPKRTEYKYDQVSGNVNLVLYEYGRPDQFIHRYGYDADNRIEEVHTSTDGYVWNREAGYSYYPHGPLARVELGEYNVQGLDYYYTLQGWLKGVNMPSEGDPGEDGINGFRTGGDAFAFALGYYEGDYKPVNPNVVVSDSRDKLWDNYKDIRGTTDARGLYNGNISWMSTDLPGLENRMQAMVYGYDQLHRIVQARSLTAYGATGYAQRGTGAGAYDVDYSYDANGNLLTLQRLDGNTSLQDDLTYEYYELSNRLKNVDGSVVESYRFDEIGNLTADVGEGIDSIAWTPYGKVRTVFKNDDSEIHFRYDAAGNRIAKVAEGDITTYVRDASGNVMGLYKNGSLIEQAVYGSSRLGLMTASSKSGYRTLGGKKYELSNHLGNVLAVVTDNINFDQDSTWANVVNVTDYYPFGLAMDGRSVQDSAYRYGFNGKEQDDEWKNSGKSYDFGARMYDPRVGKWLSVDPLADHPNQIGKSPYAAFWNNPIRWNDPDGQCPFCPWLDAVVDIGFALYDVGEITYDYVTTGEVDPVSVAALGADLTAIAVPMTTGAGLAVRATAKTVKAVDNANDVRKAVDKVNDTKKAVQKYDIGDFNDLQKRSEVGDGLDLHHVPQKKPAGQVVDGYDPKSAPAIAIPSKQHKAIPTKKGSYSGTARDQLAKDAKDLRNVGVPNNKVKEVIDYNKNNYPNTYKKNQ